MSDTHYSGPVVTGRDRGNADSNSRGTLIATQVAGFSAAMTSATRVAILPVPCRIIDIIMDADTIFATTVSAAAAHFMEVGIVGDVNRFGSIGVSAVGRYDLSGAVSGNSITKWRIPASAGDENGMIKIVAKVSSPVTALDTGNGELIITYRQE